MVYLCYEINERQKLNLIILLLFVDLDVLIQNNNVDIIKGIHIL